MLGTKTVNKPLLNHITHQNNLYIYSRKLGYNSLRLCLVVHFIRSFSFKLPPYQNLAFISKFGEYLF